ncbi:Gfo/Idh/MocA family protein [Bacillus pseudomycoides]|uniref:Gfo/Idh/MocA family protein n=1 Tax=Bacillus pseudomycoides TaxID=64104 RepID=UPI000BF604C2|nr:Gfo/Idh/MocA family oxidoreductase [Bacillus pseudomycoides]PEP85015.1 oxidoreductase [Bacillus pseudomycoides]
MLVLVNLGGIRLISSGMYYAPKGKIDKAVGDEEFIFSVIGLDHGHIYGMCNGLIEAGATLKWVYDSDPEKVRIFQNVYPKVRVARCMEEILSDGKVRLVATATIPSNRCELGIKVLSSGKDYFTDKAPFTSLEQLENAKNKVKETKLKYAVYYSERLHVEGATLAGELVNQGAIGRVLQVIGIGPHRIDLSQRPPWFFKKSCYGGILCDLGSHQIEQFLYYSGAQNATVANSKVANYHHKQFPELEDYGDATLIGDNGATNYFRVDWFTPNGLRTWGDGRTIILGTDGYIEIRKYININYEKYGNHVFLVNHEGEYYFNASGKYGYPFFKNFILDCIHRTENAMGQEHIFKVAELSLKVQEEAFLIE